MSGLEIIGGISAIIAIAEASIKVYNSAHKDLKLPEAFTTVGRQLPIVLDILQTCKRRLSPAQASVLPADVCTALDAIVENCQANVRKLRETFESVIPGDNDGWSKRYIKVLKRVGTGNTVEKLMLTITEDVQLIVNHHAVVSTESEQLAKLDHVLQQIRSLKPSNPEFSVAFHNAGGSQVNFVQTGSGQINSINHFRVDNQYLSVVTIKQHEGSRYQAPVGICLNKAPYIAPDLFVGRDLELAQMEQSLRLGDASSRHRRLVLSGAGGTGKTQLAIAFVNLHRDMYQSAFWFNATSEGTVQNSFQTVADHILGTSQDLPSSDVVQDGVALVHRWLSDPDNKQWLLIFDNYDDPDAFDLAMKYYPPASHGTIIVTTRRPDRVAGVEIRVRPLMDVQESLEILETRSQRRNTRTDPYAKQLAERLGGLPLGLATAGAYLRTSSLSFSDYLQEYESLWSSGTYRQIQAELQEYQDRTLYTTWTLSYTNLEINHPDAAKLLRLLAYFDNQNIWYGLLQAGLNDKTPEWLRSLIRSSVKFDSTMRVLTNYCFIDLQQSTGFWNMHNCVHDWTIVILDQDIVVQQYEFAFDCVATSLPEDASMMHHHSYSHLAAHAAHLVRDRFRQNRLLEDTIFSRREKAIAIFDLLRRQKRFLTAEQITLQTLAEHEKTFGPDDEFTLQLTQFLGLLALNLGKLEDAEQLLTRVLVAGERKDGSKSVSVSVFSSYYHLSWVYRNQGRLEKAEQMLARSSTGRQQLLGMEHKETVRVRICLGTLYIEQGRYDEAEHMLVQTMGISLRVCGPNHNLTLSAFINLANVYRSQNRLDEALQISLQALIRAEKALGPDDMLTIAAIDSVGIMYNARRNFDAAELFFLEALSRRKTAFEQSHPETLKSMSWLATNYSDQNEFEKAAEILLQALSRVEQAVAPSHNIILLLMSRVINIYERQGKAEQAEQVCLEALASREKLPPDHPVRIALAGQLGSIYYIQKKFMQSEELFSRILGESERSRMICRKAGIDGEYILGDCYHKQGKLDDAERTIAPAMAKRQEALGAEHQDTLTLADLLGRIYRERGKLREAEQTIRQTLTRRDKTLGPNDWDTLATLNELGLLLRDQGKLDEAERTFQRAVAGSKSVYGIDNKLTQLTTNNLEEVTELMASERNGEETVGKTDAGDEIALESTLSKIDAPRSARRRDRLTSLLGLKSSKRR